MIQKVLAAFEDYDPIKNPVLKDTEGKYANVSDNPLGFFIVRLWRAIVVVGGIALLLFLIWGAIDWLMSEGDTEKLKNAKIIYHIHQSYSCYGRLSFRFRLCSNIWSGKWN